MAHITWTRGAPVALALTALLSVQGGPAFAAEPKPPKATKPAKPEKAPKPEKVAKAAKPEKVAGARAGGLVDSLWGDDDSREGRAAARAGSWDAAADLGSMYSVTRSVGAHDAWADGVTGKGVTVAVIDTGIAPVPGLDGKDKVVDGPDLSFESQVPGTRYLDGFGHGTHMAAAIAGADEGFDPKRPSSAQFAGVAPEAELLNMKVASGDGGADVSQIIAAIDWVVEHHDEAGMDVRVINLSYGTESAQGWQVDPLARAVENAWKHGILVVAAAGNNGLAQQSLLMPAVDPHILAVGAVDHHGTSTTGDDVVAEFTNGGSAQRRPDVLAPGKSVVSLRVPGSYVDAGHPEGLVPGDAKGRFFRGSGTSQAAAVVAGEAALLFDAHPKLTPDEVKAVLQQTARPLQADTNPAQGAGVTDVAAALRRLDTKLSVPVVGLPTTRSSGLGSLEATRGGEHVVDPVTGAVLQGEVDALGAPWNAKAWVTAQSRGKAWANGGWNGRTWTGAKWEKKRLLAKAWTGSSWTGVPWTAHDWSDDAWQARSWRGDNWEARSWREASWSARSWRGMI